jgi:hypothetical protein
MWHYGISQRRCEDNLSSFSHQLRLVWSTPLGLPGRCGGHIHQYSTCRIIIRRRGSIPHVDTWRNAIMWVAFWVVCINDKFCDIRERNVTIRSGIWIVNICFLRFQDIRECVTLWRSTLQSLGRIGCDRALRIHDLVRRHVVSSLDTNHND